MPCVAVLGDTFSSRPLVPLVIKYSELGMPSLSRNHRKLLKALEKAGFEWEDKTGKKHNKISIVCPNGKSFLWVFASTPSDWRSLKNETAQLRRELVGCGYADSRELVSAGTDSEASGLLNLFYDCIEVILRELEESEIE